MRWWRRRADVEWLEDQRRRVAEFERDPEASRRRGEPAWSAALQQGRLLVAARELQRREGGDWPLVGDRLTAPGLGSVRISVLLAVVELADARQRAAERPDDPQAAVAVAAAEAELAAVCAHASPPGS